MENEGYNAPLKEREQEQKEQLEAASKDAANLLKGDLFGYTTMKALSWKEPYASLMLHGKVETRTWSTDYRGLVLICASQQPYGEKKIMEISGEKQAKRIAHKFSSYNTIPQPGKAIAIGELVDCRPMTPRDENICFAKYEEGKYCHIYRNVKAIKAFDWKGAQGWQPVPQEAIDRIKVL